MTRDDIIKLAREAGFAMYFAQEFANEFKRLVATIEFRAASAEREAIAQMIEAAPTLLADVRSNEGGCLICGFTPRLAAAAIRARSNT